ncbi:hypothetical protein P7L78_26385 [Tistrella bauzanensis]|uniref:hypothetical protein n=1 Tax=Tistrella TaxID=171436 RepID=UPI0031F6EC9A
MLRRHRLLILAPLALAACATQPSYAPPPVDPVQSMRNYHKGVERRAIASIRDLATAAAADPADTFEDHTITKAREMMKDPDATQFRNVRIVPYGAGGRLACGEINGKNSYGAYTGFVRFAGTPAEVQIEATGGSNNWLNQSLSAGITDACGSGQAG